MGWATIRTKFSQTPLVTPSVVQLLDEISFAGTSGGNGCARKSSVGHGYDFPAFRNVAVAISGDVLQFPVKKWRFFSNFQLKIDDFLQFSAKKMTIFFNFQ
jgi:hypothetical protein